MSIHFSIFAWKIHGQRSLVGYSPWDCKETNMTVQLSTHTLINTVKYTRDYKENFCCSSWPWTNTNLFYNRGRSICLLFTRSSFILPSASFSYIKWFMENLCINLYAHMFHPMWKEKEQAACYIWAPSNLSWGTSLVVQWLTLWASIAVGKVPSLAWELRSWILEENKQRKQAVLVSNSANLKWDIWIICRLLCLYSFIIFF